MNNRIASFTGLRGKLRYREPMSKHTTWRVGGPADCFYQPADREDLCDFMAQLPPAEPVFWLGLGSNLLVRDGGIRGTVICTAGRLDGYRFIDDATLRIEAGMPCARVARITAQAGYAGAEFMAGIPGTLGGALAMNGGAFGGETWTLVRRVETVDRQGRRQVRDAGEFQVGYREIQGRKDEWFLTADLELRRDPERQGRHRIRSLLTQRAKAQPVRQPSCGSVFRNPPGDHAAQLIECSGLKGLRIGDIQISEKHANFMINLGQAKAADIETLIERVRGAVLAMHGIGLVAEVKIVGEYE
jgi:UDP-N-acetylmuramate dehydrogenase